MTRATTHLSNVNAGDDISLYGTLPGQSVSAATTSTAGSMSAADKTKLDGIEAGATATIDSIADSDTTHPPSRNAVFDALAGKISFPADRVTTAATYTAVLEDEGRIVRCNSASAQSFVIPPNADVAFPIGSTLGVFQNNTGATTVTAGAGVTLRGIGGGAVSPSAQYGCVIYRKYLTDNWLVVSRT